MDASMILLTIRRRLSILRAELSRLCGVSRSTVGRIEKGELDPSWGTLTQILESSGFTLCGESVVPTRDATAAVAARLVLDRALGGWCGAPARAATLPAPDGSATLPAPDGSAALPAPDGSAALLGLEGPAEVQVWWERWRRAGWLSDAPTVRGITALARHASVVSTDSPGAMPHLVVGDGRRWRDLALRIDEAGFTYAVSDTAAGLESPGAWLVEVPRIYVSDPAMVASVLRLEESAPDRGIQLVSAEWPELENIVVGDGICFTSVGQSIVDGLTGDAEEYRKARQGLFHLLLELHPLG